MGMHHLTVVRDFASYRRGDHIEDETEIERLLKGEHRHHVVKVHADEKPAIVEVATKVPAADADKSLAESVIFKS